jgi:Protein of unknown function (DUF3800)
MLQAYLDESGAHRDARYYVVSGYIADRDDWEEFNGEWHAVLDKHGITGWFHLVDFKNRFRIKKSKYGHIDKAEGFQLLDELTTAIKKRVILGIGGALPMDAYNELVQDKYERYVGQPYTFCTNIMLMAVKRWADEIHYRSKYHEPIQFFFEQGAEHAGEMQAAFNEAIQLPEFKNEGWLGTHTYLTKGNTRGLEAADLLAHALYSEKTGQLQGWDPQVILAWIKRTPLRILEIDKRGLHIAILMRVSSAVTRQDTPDTETGGGPTS